MDVAECEEFLRREVGDLVGRPVPSLALTFAAAGGDSLRGIHLVSAIAERYGVVIDVVEVLKPISLRDLGALIAKRAR